MTSEVTAQQLTLITLKTRTHHFQYHRAERKTPEFHRGRIYPELSRVTALYFLTDAVDLPFITARGEFLMLLVC